MILGAPRSTEKGVKRLALAKARFGKRKRDPGFVVSTFQQNAGYVCWKTHFSWTLFHKGPLKSRRPARPGDPRCTPGCPPGRLIPPPVAPVAPVANLADRERAKPPLEIEKKGES